MTISSSTDAPAPLLSTTAVMRAITAELREITEDCLALETLISEISGSALNGRLLQRLQAFDLIIQRMSGVGAVAETLCNHAPIAWVDADLILSKVSLTAQVARLSGWTDGAPTGSSGDAEIW